MQQVQSTGLHGYVHRFQNRAGLHIIKYSIFEADRTLTNGCHSYTSEPQDIIIALCETERGMLESRGLKKCQNLEHDQSSRRNHARHEVVKIM